MEVKRLLLVGAVVLLSCTCLADNLVGESAPEITIRQWVTENPPDIKNLKGRVYVVEFWATWCYPCIQSIPHLNEFSKKYEDKGLIFISLCQDKNLSQLRRFLQDKGIDYHVAIDNGTVDWFGVTGYPTVAVVNHCGKVVWQGHPWNSGFEKAVIKAITAGPPPLLAGVDLGPFEDFKSSLWGGKDFAKAYKKIASNIGDCKNLERCTAAKQIVETINQRIQQKISSAEKLIDTAPLEAYGIFAEIVSKYDGIEVTVPARQAWQKLGKYTKYTDITDSRLVVKRITDIIE